MPIFLYCLLTNKDMKGSGQKDLPHMQYFFFGHYYQWPVPDLCISVHELPAQMRQCCQQFLKTKHFRCQLYLHFGPRHHLWCSTQRTVYMQPPSRMFVPHMHFSICYSVVSRSCCVYTAELVLHNFLTSYELLCSGLQQRRQNERTWYETQNWALNITFSHTCPNIFIDFTQSHNNTSNAVCHVSSATHMPKHFCRIHRQPQ